ncbi:Tubulin beta-1 chain [Platanthera guangdongensis]|uniref:Tubulin beta-1 chain n=1 Tax=Platanthera guangdongensis TaxID=2320717 RepID=A0ABR2LQV8_9ASPA
MIFHYNLVESAPVLHGALHRSRLTLLLEPYNATLSVHQLVENTAECMHARAPHRVSYQYIIPVRQYRELNTKEALSARQPQTIKGGLLVEKGLYALIQSVKMISNAFKGISHCAEGIQINTESRKDQPTVYHLKCLTEHRLECWPLSTVHPDGQYQG